MRAVPDGLDVNSSQEERSNGCRIPQCGLQFLGEIAWILDPEQDWKNLQWRLAGTVRAVFHTDMVQSGQRPVHVHQAFGYVE